MAEVRIRLAVGGVCLEYSGTRSFFERLVEPLVEAAYSGASDLHAEEGPRAPDGQCVEDAGEPASADRESDAAADEIDTTESGPVFHPRSPAQFNHYARQVGESAGTIEQRVMAFAFYLWNYERQEEFPPVDIEAFFRTVHQDPPEDLPARLSDLAERKRFLEPGTTENTWRLTSKGVNYVKNRLLAAME